MAIGKTLLPIQPPVPKYTVDIFTASGTYTKPANLDYAYVFMQSQYAQDINFIKIFLLTNKKLNFVKKPTDIGTSRVNTMLIRNNLPEFGANLVATLSSLGKNIKLDSVATLTLKNFAPIWLPHFPA